jgi:Putative zinc-finger
MNDHKSVSNLLPQYAAGTLTGSELGRVEAHLPMCHTCRADLALWRALSRGIVEGNEPVAAPAGLAESVLRRMDIFGRKPPAIVRAARLLGTQFPIIRREIWSVSALVMILGFTIALIKGQADILSQIAPMIAATCVVLLIGPQNDPADELIRSTPTSRRQILLARLALVFGWNLILACFASLGLFPLLTPDLWGGLILSWIGPMAFLSSLALILSLWIGTNGAVGVVYGIWLAQWVLPGFEDATGPSIWLPALLKILEAPSPLWNSPLLLLALSGVLLAVAIWFAGKKEPNNLRWT